MNPVTRTIGGIRQQRVLVVDDHPMTRSGLAHLIRQEHDLEVCGQAGDRHEALRLLSGSAVDLVITDITMPPMAAFPRPVG